MNCEQTPRPSIFDAVPGMRRGGVVRRKSGHPRSCVRNPERKKRAMRTESKVLLLIESSRATGRALLRGIARYAHDHGPWSFYWEPRGLEKSWPKLRAIQADGIILRDVENVEEILSRHLSTVIVEHRRREVSGQVNVMTDSETIGRLAADHLLKCGFQRFAYCGYAQSPWSQERCRSFTRRIRASGFDVAARWETSSETRRPAKGSRKALENWLKTSRNLSD